MAKNKRKPTPPKRSKRKSSKGSGKSTPKNNMSGTKDIRNANSEVAKNVSIYNSALDNKLVVKDAYEGKIENTLNNLYKFSNTFSLDNVLSAIKGGVSMLNNVTDYIRQARQIGEAVKKGNILDAVGAIAPGAKHILEKMGVDPKLVDRVQEFAQMGVNVAGTYKKVRSGEMSILDGLSAISQSLLGVDIAEIKDLQAIMVSVTSIIKEYSEAGIAIKGEWKKLVQEWDRDKNEPVAGGWNIATEVALLSLHALAENGDYETMLEAIKAADPVKINRVAGNLMSTLLSKYSRYSPHNRDRDPKEILALIVKVMKALDGDGVFWIETNDRALFNMRLFMDASADFKELIKSELGQPFIHLNHNGNLTQLEYTDEDNKLLMLLNQVFSQVTTNADNELKKDFPKFTANPVMRVSNMTSPGEFAGTNKLVWRNKK